jgi:hypothetical protein
MLGVILGKYEKVKQKTGICARKREREYVQEERNGNMCKKGKRKFKRKEQKNA